MVGTSHLWLSGLILATSFGTIMCAFYVFESKTFKYKVLGYQVFTALLWLCFAFVMLLIYMTRNRKKLECVYWIETFMDAASNTFYVDSFVRNYSTSTNRDYFVQQRTLEVHYVSICLLLLSMILYVIFVRNFKRLTRYTTTDGAEIVTPLLENG